MTLCLASLVEMLGCATANHAVHLRAQEELPRVDGRSPMVGYLSSDSLWIYRSRGEGSHESRVRPVGRGVEIGGYTLADGRHVKFEGTVLRAGDSLRFERHRPGWSMEATGGPHAFVLPLSEVQSVDVQLPDAGRTVMAVAIFTLFTATAWVFAAAASLSEPLL